MKKTIAIILVSLSAMTFGLDGLSQARIEKVYDIYRVRYIEWKSIEEQSVKIKQTQELLQHYRDLTTTTPERREIFGYFQHLLCEAESIINGNPCNDNYNPAGPLTIEKNNFTLTQIRNYLIAEHSNRRVARNIGPLAESPILNNIAQDYALKLCQAWYISHELGGSLLEERYRDGGYQYISGWENLWSGQTSIGEILDQLTTSFHHRENMYHPNFTEIGVGQCANTWVLNYGQPERA